MNRNASRSYDRLDDEEPEPQPQPSQAVRSPSITYAASKGIKQLITDGAVKRKELTRFLRRARSQTSKELQQGMRLAVSWKEWFWTSSDGVLPVITAWLLWMSVGTVFYAHTNFSGSYCKGFYFSINVGYSIGWGVLHEHTAGSKLFSVAYLLVGAIFVSRWLAYLIETAVKDQQGAYEQLILRKHLQRSITLTGISAQVYIFMVMNNAKLFIIYLWVIYIFFGLSWSIGAVGWDFTDGLYFSISSMSTGGLQGVPEDSPDWVFLIVGLFAATGVPLMGMAVANIAHFIFSSRRLSQLEEVKSLEITPDDYDLLKAVNEEACESKALQKSEFILLCLAQQGLLDWKDLQAILRQFEDLDTADKGVVTFNVKRGDSIQRTLNPLLHTPSSPGRSQSPKKVALMDIAQACLPSTPLAASFNSADDSEHLPV